VAINGLDFTSREYNTILEDLVSTIPEVSQIWNSTDENDPGIVLLKLMSMVGDMLSYRQDKSVAEVYPTTVKELKNARQVFMSTGYKMHWYKSALCNATVVNTATVAINIPRFTTVSSSNGSATYTYFGSYYESYKNVLANGGSVTIEVVEGTPRTPPKTANVAESETYWHSIYSYNVHSADIINNRIYFNIQNVDDSHIVLVDNQNEEWTLVDNIEAVDGTGKYYSFDIDESENPYIKIVDNWQLLDDSTISKFKLFYIQSSGEVGQISDDILALVSSPVYATVSSVLTNISNLLVVTNTASNYGYNPETADEARAHYLKYATTHDTIVTLVDMVNVIKRLVGVSNCFCTDITNDPYSDKPDNVYVVYTSLVSGYYNTSDGQFYETLVGEVYSDLITPSLSNAYLSTDTSTYYRYDGTAYIEYAAKVDGYYNSADGNFYTTYADEEYSNLISPSTDSLYLDQTETKYYRYFSGTGMTNTNVRAYVTRSDEYSTYDKSAYRQYIINQISSYKLMPLSVYVYLEDEPMYEDPDNSDTQLIADKATTYYYWTPEGTLYLKKPVSKDVAQSILQKVSSAIENTFGIPNVEYNTTIKYSQLISTIVGADANILYADVTPIKYYSTTEMTSEVTSANIIGRYTQTATMGSAGTSESITLTYAPVKPRSVYIDITIGSNTVTISDDANGKFYGSSSIVDYDNSTVDYSTGSVMISFTSSVTASLSVKYNKNLVGLVKFNGVDSAKLTVADESIKLI